ncbi:hypothetical protein OAC45_03650 [Gammaproteobacteria bacterium]|jgi:hypothetical protein|nr:hypothetical protein [Gammaproteobacteria bacterium]|tara:strand:- start:837 stop:1148 length:312 start_codon:yes stop_codon:yes gene_type:complete
MNYCRVDKSAKPTGKYVLLDRSFEALYQNLDDIKALRIQRAVDELDNIYFLKDKRALNELFAEQEVLVDRLLDNFAADEDNFTPYEMEEVIARLSNLLKRISL